MAERRRRPRKWLGLAVLAVAALAFGGCDWTTFGYDAALTHSSADTAINSGNASTLKPLFTSTGAYTSPVESGGVVYAGGQSGNLFAFDASGVNGCSGSPNQCTPLWTGTTGGVKSGGTPAVANGVVYIFSDVLNKLYAFDAKGVNGCSGSPKVCQPLWVGVLYTTGGDQVFAYSADGTTNCSGAPTICDPLWTATMGTSSSTSSPAVSNGVAYTESADAKLFAFDTNGVTGCSGTPTTCRPLWTAALSGIPQFGSSPAVANGIVHAPSSTLQAFDANGVINCSGTPKTCTPRWSYNVSVMSASPSLANGVLFIGSWSGSQLNGFDFMSFDANGKVNCSGTPTICNPLWTGVATAPLTYSPAIANGKVYVADNPFGIIGLKTHLYAWTLPQPTTAVVLPSNGAKVSGTQVLDASASPGVSQVQYELTGGSLNHAVIATATKATYYGWVASWSTASVPNGVYTLQSVASYGGEVSGTSPGVTITVSN